MGNIFAYTDLVFLEEIHHQITDDHTTFHAFTKLMSHSCSRIEPLDRQGQTADYLETTGLVTARKSQEAAVSAIVKMLKNAPPLRPEPSMQLSSHVIRDETRTSSMEQNTVAEVMASPGSSASVAGMTTSEFIRSRTVADAFEELRGFKERKELLLRRIGSQISESPSKDS